MRVALAVDNNMITEHFGHCEYFVVYEVENKEIKGSEILKNPPHVKGALPKFLKDNLVDVVITGNIGKMAIDLLNNLGIQCLRGVNGELVDVINAFVNETLTTNDIECNHHEHHGGEHHHNH